MSLPTIEEVVTWGRMRNISTEVCEAYWYSRAEMGWKKKGSGVVNWQPGLMGFANTWRGIEAERKKPAGEEQTRDLEAALAAETDPQKRAELRAKLSRK